MSQIYLLAKISADTVENNIMLQIDNKRLTFLRKIGIRVLYKMNRIVSLHQAAVSYAERRMINQAMGLTVNETPGAVPMNSRPGSGAPLK